MNNHAHLVLVRHGQSLFNQTGRYTGWQDAPLTDLGRAQARRAGLLLGAAGLRFDAAYSSRLSRAAETLDIALEALGQVKTPVTRHWRLNERHVGLLQGRTKAEVSAAFGPEMVRAWRYELSLAPPPMPADDPRHPANDPGYADVEPGLLPSTESLGGAQQRVAPCWRAEIAPLLAAGAAVLVAGHGLSLWALARLACLEAGGDLPVIKMPNANPLVIGLGPGLRVESMAYLDPDSAGHLPTMVQTAAA